MQRKGVYKKKMVFIEKGVRHKYQREREKKQEEHWKKRVNSVVFCITLASSGRLVGRHLLIYSIILAISSLFSFLGRALSYYLFPSLTNFIDLGQGWTIQSTILSGLGLLDFLVLIVGMALEFRLMDSWTKERWIYVLEVFILGHWK